MHSLHAIIVSLLVAGHAIAAPSLKRKDNINTDASTPSPIRVSIKSANGTDLTPSFSALTGNVNPPHPSNRLAKRDVARAMNACPDHNSWFAQSYCNRQAGPLQQSFTIECDVPDTSTVGVCLPNEICVDGITSGPLSPVMAYCVSVENFVKIAADKTSQGFLGNLAGDAADWDTKNVAIEAVLTGADKDSPALYAQRMEITAYDAMGVPVGGDKGTNACAGATTCASIGLQPLPHGTKEVGIDITLPAGSVGGSLWLPVVSPFILG